MAYRYRIVDVLTIHPLEGNPLAVFPNATGLDESTMQKIARELNLSETTFILPPIRPNCCARVRIFSPNQEMDFAGHPVIGTSFVLLDEGNVPKPNLHFSLDMKIGPIPIRLEPGEQPRIWLTTPAIKWEATYDRALCAEALGLSSNDFMDVSPQLLSAGNPSIFIAVKDKGLVDLAQLNQARLQTIKGLQKAVCVFVFTPILKELTRACSLPSTELWKTRRREVQPVRWLHT
jgi:trans-2,3-dihydro-3-hydroxyanthranilate isomerase